MSLWRFKGTSKETSKIFEVLFVFFPTFWRNFVQKLMLDMSSIKVKISLIFLSDNLNVQTICEEFELSWSPQRVGESNGISPNGNTIFCIQFPVRMPDSWDFEVRVPEVNLCWLSSTKIPERYWLVQIDLKSIETSISAIYVLVNVGFHLFMFLFERDHNFNTKLPNFALEFVYM